MLERLSPSVHRHAGIANTYVVTRGEHALLVDTGDGEVLSELAGIGAETVEWVLHTHHHRDQCLGDARLGPGTAIAVPAREAGAFEAAERFWATLETADRYDCTNVHSTLPASVPVARRLADFETFSWRGVDFAVLPAPGHTKGAIVLLARIDGLLYAFCGDLICAPGRVWTLYDLHWDYSNPDAINAALHSVHALRGRRPDVLAPAHGEPMTSTADAALEQLEGNLRRLHAVAGVRFAGDVDVPIASDLRLVRVSEHLVGVTQACAHFYALVDGADALLFDYGHASYDHITGAGCRFVEHSLDALREAVGIERIDVVVPTHYHDDHVAGIPHLQRRFGTEVWAFEAFADVLARPHAYRLPARLAEPIVPDRVYGAADTLEWRGHELSALHCRGHTWHAVALVGEIDGRRVGVIGDEIQLDAAGRMRGGGPVYANRLGADAFSSSVRAIAAREPELLLTGHDGVLEVGRAELDAALDWSLELEAALAALAPPGAAPGFALDPSFVRVDPYEAAARGGRALELALVVRGHAAEACEVRLRASGPSGWRVTPGDVTLAVQPGRDATVAVAVEPPAGAAAGRHLLLVDVTVDGRRYGPLAEGLIDIQEDAA